MNKHSSDLKQAAKTRKAAAAKQPYIAPPVPEEALSYKELLAKNERSLLKAKSTIGSSIFLITDNELIPANSPAYCIEVRWDAFSILPKSWADNSQLFDNVERGKIIVDVSPGRPDNPLKIGESLEREHREMLRTWMYGPMTSGIKLHLEDWRDKNNTRRDPGRIAQLLSRVLPFVKAALVAEPQIQNRFDMIAELKKVERFIEEKLWEQEGRNG